MDAELESEIRTCLERGDKIQAIKICREGTNLGLIEAKNLVESIENGDPVAPPTGSLEKELIAILEKSGKIAAIKHYRDRTGAGLKDAKDTVELIASENRVIIAPGKGCLSSAALFTFLAVLITWFSIAS